VKLRAVLLTEGSREQGFGHVSRCLSIAQGFQAAGIESKIIVDTKAMLAPILGGVAHATGNWKSLETVDSLLQGADIAVIDSYTVSQPIVDHVAFAVNVPVFVDDNLQQRYRRGVVLNGSIYAHRLKYPRKSGLTLLLGTWYVPLRRAFWAPVRRRTGSEIKKVLVMFGGTDARNLTAPAVRALQELPSFVSIDLVAGKGFRDGKNADQIDSHRVKIFESLDDRAVRERMAACDVALSSSGQTLYELARMGVPAVSLAVADNQVRNLNGFAEHGIVKSIGWYATGLLSHKILRALGELKSPFRRRAMSERARKAVDGKGPERITRAVLDYDRRYGVTVTPVTVKDSADILKLSNEKSVRAASFSPAKITPDEHRRWFRSKTSSRNFFMLLARSHRGALLGQIRFQVGGTSATISISVSERARGRGVGLILFHRGLAALQRRYRIRRIDAEIQTGNKMSQNFFKSLGFERVSAMLYRKNV
jgi:spore coat polysaccharide biosynthesis predicted glycosyltransferase SpsG/RimJ/RimL family protein N-acetyltransferase